MKTCSHEYHAPGGTALNFSFPFCFCYNYSKMFDILLDNIWSWYSDVV